VVGDGDGDELDEEAALGTGCERGNDGSAGTRGGWSESDDIEEF
jgi:hypothetical protein